MSELTPMPSAITAITMSVNPGVRRSERSAYRMSWMSVSMGSTPGERDGCRGAASRSVPALLVHDAAVEELDRALCVAGEARIVRHHADRAPLLVQVAQQVHHRFAVRRVE